MTIHNPTDQKSFEALQSCSGDECVESGGSENSMRASFSLDDFTVVPMAHHRSLSHCAHTRRDCKQSTLTIHISTTMTPIDNALAELASSASPNISATAKSHGIHPSTLSRRWRGRSTSKEIALSDRRFLNNEQERSLINYINELSKRSAAPTPAMVTAFASQLAGRAPGHCWVSRFVSRHRSELESAYLNNLDLDRHQADSIHSFEAYFTTVNQKIQQHQISEDNIYNMDEKGFLLGRLNKVRGIFLRDLKGSGKLLGAVQDGSRDWLTVAATICAHGTALAPLLIYQSDAGTVQDSWLKDFNPEEQDCFFSSSPSGRTSDEIGSKWLQELFDTRTAAKARRNWRLLFVDGHGSHVTIAFLQKALEKKILVVIYPPHTTHRLQPLDVGCFAPLSTHYSQSLESFCSRSEGLTKMSQKEFFGVFWPAWQKAFTEANIRSSWKKTGLVPWRLAVVLDKLKQQPSAAETRQRRLSSSPPLDWGSPTARRSVRKAVGRSVDRNTKKLLSRLTDELLSTKAQLTIAKLEKKKALDALRAVQKKQRRGKKLIEEFRASEDCGAVVFSPSKVRKLLDLQKAREQAKEQQKIDKALKAQQTVAARELKARETEQRKYDRAAASAARKKADADAKAERKAVKEALRAQKQREKERKAANRRQGRSVAKQKIVKKVTASVRQPLAQMAPNQQSSRSGRAIKKPARLL